MSDEQPLSADLLYGAQQIADFLGIETRNAYYQIERGYIPTTRMGSTIVASKSALRRRFAPSEVA